MGHAQNNVEVAARQVVPADHHRAAVLLKVLRKLSALAPHVRALHRRHVLDLKVQFLRGNIPGGVRAHSQCRSVGKIPVVPSSKEMQRKRASERERKKERKTERKRASEGAREREREKRERSVFI